MNQLNVDALTDIVSRCGVAPQHASWARSMARSLANQGVLVPAVLTGEQLVDVYCVLDSGHPELGSNDPDAQAGARDRLASIAKGEA